MEAETFTKYIYITSAWYWQFNFKHRK